MTIDLSEAARPTFHTLTADMMPRSAVGTATKSEEEIQARAVDAKIRADVALLHANHQKKLATQMAENRNECVQSEMRVEQKAPEYKSDQPFALRRVS